MSRSSVSEARRAGWMILGLLAIPVVSVTTVALLADVASTTDPAAALAGIPATLGGLVMGALVFRLGRAAYSGAVALRAIVLAHTADVRPAVAHGWRSLVAGAEVRPALVLVPARVGRRGPPVRSR